MLTSSQIFWTIALISLATLLTRALPFLLFPDPERTPRTVLYLGRVLPYAAMGMLVVYCLKGVTLTAAPFGIPEALGMAAVVGLHLWKHNTLLSIAAGTILYMVLVQMVF